MKKILFLFFFLFFYVAYSQVPQSINYQSVVRDDAGALAVNKDVEVKFSILNQGNVIFSETHMTRTSSNGLISLKLGTSNPADFKAINWNSEFLSILTEITLLDGSVQTILTENIVSSVPYALMAKESEESNKNLELIINEIDRSTAVDKSLQDEIDLKQDKLVAGDGITITIILSQLYLEKQSPQQKTMEMGLLHSLTMMELYLQQVI